MKSENYPKFDPADKYVPLECRTAGMDSEQLVHELRALAAFFKYGSFGWTDIHLKNQMIVMLELRDVPDDVIDGAIAMGEWEGHLAFDRLYSKNRNDAVD